MAQCLPSQGVLGLLVAYPIIRDQLGPGLQGSVNYGHHLLPTEVLWVPLSFCDEKAVPRPRCSVGGKFLVRRNVRPQKCGEVVGFLGALHRLSMTLNWQLVKHAPHILGRDRVHAGLISQPRPPSKIVFRSPRSVLAVLRLLRVLVF